VAAIVVVGGGIAGLTCAWRLQRAGHDVEVLEREPNAGGRLRSERRGDFVVERGAQFVTGAYRNLHAVVAALGLQGRLRGHVQRGEAVLRDGAMLSADVASPWRLIASPLLSPAAKLRLTRLPFLLLQHRHQLEPLHPERAAELDRGSMAAVLRPVVGEEAFDFLVAPIFSAIFDAEPEDLSVAFALLMLRFFAGGARPQSFAGGNGELTRALARQVTVRAGCEAIAVETETDGARVRYRRGGRDGAVFADAVVIAVPGSEVAGLCAKLTPAERGFFEQVRYARGIVAHLLLPRVPRPLPPGGLAFPRRAGFDLYGLAVDHHKPGVAPPGAGLVNAALCDTASERLWHEEDAAVAELVLANLARTPIGRLEPSEVVVHRWPAMLPCFYSGYLKQLASFQRRMERSPRMAFAGDYLLGPTVEAALTSGMRAATEISRALSRPGTSPK